MKEEWVIVLHYPPGREAELPFTLDMEAEAHLCCRQLREWCGYRLSYRRRRARDWCVYRLGLDASRRLIGEFETRVEADCFAAAERRSHEQALRFEFAGGLPGEPRYLFTVEPRLAAAVS